MVESADTLFTFSWVTVASLLAASLLAACNCLQEGAWKLQWMVMGNENFLIFLAEQSVTKSNQTTTFKLNNFCMMGSACEVKICICYNSAKSKPALDQVLHSCSTLMQKFLIKLTYYSFLFFYCSSFSLEVHIVQMQY